MTRRVVEPFMGIGCQELMADGCSHSGMVEKESQKLGLKIDVSRYLVLKSGCLYCYSHHTDAKATEQLSLAGYRLSNAPEKKGHAFKLVFPDPRRKTQVFTLGSAREKDEWMTKIQEDIEKYCCGGEEGAPYEDVEDMDQGHNVYLDPMSRPAAPLPDPAERARKSQSLYIPRHSVTFPRGQTQTSISPPFNWPLPPVPGEESGATSSRRISDPGGPVAGEWPLPQVPSKSPKPGTVPAKSGTVQRPRPSPRPKPQPEPVPETPPKPSSRGNQIPSQPGETRNPHLRRYTSEPQMNNVQSFAGALADELKKKQKPRIGDDSRSAREGPVVGRESKERPRERKRPEGESFKQTNPARPSVDPPTSNVLGKDLSSSAPKGLDTSVKAAKFLNGKMPGAFILRDSSSADSGKAISVWMGTTAKHYRVFCKQGMGYALSHDGPEFSTIKRLVDYYHHNTLP